jgi:hypothetical protein
MIYLSVISKKDDIDNVNIKLKVVQDIFYCIVRIIIYEDKI